jgi:hypothetical protein
MDTMLRNQRKSDFVDAGQVPTIDISKFGSLKGKKRCTKIAEDVSTSLHVIERFFSDNFASEKLNKFD